MTALSSQKYALHFGTLDFFGFLLFMERDVFLHLD
jgi:hypothetical protein